MDSQKEKFFKIFDSIDFRHINDHPNILVAAKFWSHERYSAAETFYKFMRRIDDLIDDYKASHKTITQPDKKEFVRKVNDWLKMIIDSGDHNPFREEMIRAIQKFSIPLWPLEDFAKAMIYDIQNDGFPTLEAFLGYSRGASVAPASIFVHLNGLVKKNGRLEPPGFDVREAAMPCAIFSYLVHIIRDFQKDQLNNLNYFADDLIARYRMTRFDLKEIAYGHPVSDSFRKLIQEYYSLADEYRMKTVDVINKIRPLHEPRYQLSLEIIFNLYLMVFEKIDVVKGNFKTAELNPTPEETRQRVYDTIINFIKE